MPRLQAQPCGVWSNKALRVRSDTRCLFQHVGDRRAASEVVLTGVVDCKGEDAGKECRLYPKEMERPQVLPCQALVTLESQLPAGPQICN